jgi:DNA-binding NtrC family response regulator
MYKESVSPFHQGVENFKKELLTTTLEAHGGNRTHAARTLGLQRTYLLRLMRDLEVRVPKSERLQQDTNGE